MSAHPVIACYHGIDSADGVQLGALLAAALGEPLVLAGAYHYDAVGLSASPLPAADNARRADEALAQLRHARQFVPDDVEVREEVVPAEDIVDALVALAGDVEACVVAVGRDTSGHVTRSLLTRAPCPVAVAPRNVPRPRSGPLRRIGVAYDGSPTAQRALDAAAGLARATTARLVLLSAARSMERAAVWLDVARLSLASKVEHESHALVGEADEALTEASGDLDLLVCGTRGRGRAIAALLGSVSGQLVARAHCPVLVVPPAVPRSAGGPRGLTALSARA